MYKTDNQQDNLLQDNPKKEKNRQAIARQYEVKTYRKDKAIANRKSRQQQREDNRTTSDYRKRQREDNRTTSDYRKTKRRQPQDKEKTKRRQPQDQNTARRPSTIQNPNLALTITPTLSLTCVSLPSSALKCAPQG